MLDFIYQDTFPVGEDDTDYFCLTNEYVKTINVKGNEVLKIEPEGLTLLAERALKDVSFLLRASHLKLIAAIIDDPESSINDKYVATEILKNAVIAAEGVFPLCQDTGTAVVLGRKGELVWTGFSEKEALAKGIFNTYLNNNLRYSQNAALTMFEEKNTACNLPAQIELYLAKGDAYSFLFMAKGGGSANKTHLYQETKAILVHSKLVDFLAEKVRSLGTTACPPYCVAIVIGGTSAEFNLKTVKMASAGYLDKLPTKGSDSGHAFRDLDLEAELLARSRKFGIGAQFGGKYFCLAVRVVRLSRHAASCPIGIGVSCIADRNIKAKVTKEGIFLERLETNPAKYLPSTETQSDAVRIDLNKPMDEIRAILTQYPIATRFLLSGKVVVARDAAHAKIKERLDRGEGLPQYLKDHIVYYAGPAKTPPGYPSGSCGPTSAWRMDPYVPIFQEHGGSMVMLAKGNRSKIVIDACKKYKGFYLGAIGGTAARLGKECITNLEVIEYPELGMEAVHMLTVKDFPAFIIVDDKGNDFFEGLI